MRVVVDIPPDLVDDIRSAVQSGGYESPEEFLKQALRTQLELESSEQETLMSFSEAVQTGKSTESERSSDEEISKVNPTSSPAGLEDLPDLSIRDFDVLTVDPPVSDRIDTEPLWGQYNRIFPMKLSIRRLAIVLSQRGLDEAPYQRFRDETAKVARAYGLRLHEIDEEQSRGRGEKFSAALPTGDKVERSKDRFKTHFVGQIDSSGNLTGSLPNLQFVNIHPETNGFGITQAALEFAQIDNPLLDEDIRSDESLSDTERQFYLDHVTNEHPAEFEAMSTVADAIANGINRPDPLSERVGELSDDWSSAQASTVRSGLIGRMHELGLVSRKRVGVRGVGYEITDRGELELL